MNMDTKHSTEAKQKAFAVTGQTKLIALIGNPVIHSISPLMHNEAYRQLDLDYIYLAFHIETDKLRDALKGLTALQVTGFNVTMPFKTEILCYLDELTPQAKLSGSVNTVRYKNNKLIGHSTDGIGYMQSLREAGLNMQGEKMTILGAGGAAASICVQAAIDGISQIDIFKRTSSIEQDHSWNETLSFCRKLEAKTDCKISLYDINDPHQLKISLKESRLLTNATSVGMAPNCNSSIMKDSSMLHKNLFVSDIIYNPRETLLLKQARLAGCNYLNGLNMLLYQGAEAFHYFTGERMPIEIIKQKFFS